MTVMQQRAAVWAAARPPLEASHAILDAGDHAVVFLGGGSWALRHPQTCPATEIRDCAVSKAAQRTLKLSDYLPGAYACDVDQRGWLRTRGGRR